MARYRIFIEHIFEDGELDEDSIKLFKDPQYGKAEIDEFLGSDDAAKIGIEEI